MHFFDALLAGNGLSRAFARPGVASCPLAMNRQAFPVANAPVTGDIAKPGDILGNLSAKLPANGVTSLDNLGNAAQLIFGELARLGIPVNLGFDYNRLSGMSAYTINIRQGNPYRLLIRNINTNYTRHICSL
jgi:hypothetical protein